MMLRSRRMLRYAVPLTVVWLMSACADGDREQPLSRVETIDIPEADTTTTVNINIDNPNLNIPDTFQVADGDLLTLVWSDEFNGTKLDPNVWFFETGDGSQYDIPGWGNNELQYYLPDNARLEGGKLIIDAKLETVTLPDDRFGYTSARINTRDRFAFKYGRIEASIKMPAGQGLWPAFWMLSQDSDYLCDGEPCVWAAIGEIDIVEAVNLGGTGGNEIFGTIHYGGEFPNNQSTETRYTPSVNITESFNTYAVEWDEFEIRWYFNGLLYAMQNSWDSDADGKDFPAPFDQDFYVLFNLAVGGNFPGSPNGTTPFPSTMEVDWVRVYSGEEPPPVDPADRGLIPEVIISAADGAAPDLVVGFDPFGSGTGIVENFAGDSSFANVVQVTVGGGYGGGALAQVGLTGQDAGFATGFDEFLFKVKGLDADNTILAKLEEPFPGPSIPVQVDLTAPPAGVTVTDLGDGWSQVVIPVSAYGDVSTFSQAVFQTLDGAYAQGDIFYLADIGFNNADGGGGAGEIAVNGGFESGDFTGWTQFEAVPGDQTVNTGMAGDTSSEGTFHLEINNTAAGANSLIKQERVGAGTVAPGIAWTVTFDARGTFGAGGVAFAQVFSETAAGPENCDGCGILGGAPLALNADPTVWSPFSFSGTAGPNTESLTLQLEAVTGPGALANVFYDNISIVVGDGGG